MSGRTTEQQPDGPLPTSPPLASISKVLPVTAHRRAAVLLSSLVESLSVRNDGVDEEHVTTLLEAQHPLPPIVVHASTLTLIDGAHRVSAARRRGDRTIDAVLVDCPAEEAVLLAVQLNTRHGLPLSRAYRRAAAQQILRLHPEWSDRRIAGIAGLSPKTVGSVRRSASEEIPQSGSRIGIDGRSRSIEAGAPRRVTRLSATSTTEPTPPEDSPPVVSSDTSMRLLRSLGNDPSMRGAQSTRLLLQMFSSVQMLVENEFEHILAAVPAHRHQAVATVARECALRLTQLATALEGRL